MNADAAPLTASALARLAATPRRAGYGMPSTAHSRQALPGSSAASAPAAAARPGPISITGTVILNARVGVGAGRDPEAPLSFHLGTPLGLDFRISYGMGSGYASHLAASQKALRLMQGHGVTVTCEGLASDGSTGMRLLCMGVRTVEPHQPPPTPPAGAAGPHD